MPKKKAKAKIDWRNKHIQSAAIRAIGLFNEIAVEHGEEVAREIFDTTGFAVRRLSRSEKAEMRGWLILVRLDGVRNRSELARQLSAEGLGTFSTVYDRIRALEKKREKAMANGTWPTWAPVPGQNEKGFAFPLGVVGF